MFVHYSLGKREDVSLSTSIATSVLERVLDGLAILVVLLVGIMTIPTTTNNIPLLNKRPEFLVHMALICFIPPLVVLFGLMIQKERALNVLKKLLEMLGLREKATGLLKIAENFVNGLKSLHGITACFTPVVLFTTHLAFRWRGILFCIASLLNKTVFLSITNGDGNHLHWNNGSWAPGLRRKF